MINRRKKGSVVVAAAIFLSIAPDRFAQAPDSTPEKPPVRSVESQTRAQRRSFLADSLRKFKEGCRPKGSSSTAPLKGLPPPPNAQNPQELGPVHLDQNPLPGGHFVPPKPYAPVCIPCSGLSPESIQDSDISDSARSAVPARTGKSNRGTKTE